MFRLAFWDAPISALARNGDRQEYRPFRTVINLSYKIKIIKEGNATVKGYMCWCISITLPDSS